MDGWVRSEISNTKLMVQILRIALKLVEDVRSVILKMGKRTTGAIYEARARPIGVLSWATEIREWLKDTRHVCYLGVLEVNP